MQATPEEKAEGFAIVQVLASVLDRLASANAATAISDPGMITKFHAMKAPGIGIQQYLERIHKYAGCSNECYILALIYIDRLIQKNNFLLTELNVHRVCITAILLAAKFFDDFYYNNAYYAKIGGVMIPELNGLEVDFLFRINFSLHVTPEEFHQYQAELLSQTQSLGYRANATTPTNENIEVSQTSSNTMTSYTNVTPSPPPDAQYVMVDHYHVPPEASTIQEPQYHQQVPVYYAEQYQGHAPLQSNFQQQYAYQPCAQAQMYHSNDFDQLMTGMFQDEGTTTTSYGTSYGRGDRMVAGSH